MKSVGQPYVPWSIMADVLDTHLSEIGLRAEYQRGKLVFLYKEQVMHIPVPVEGFDPRDTDRIIDQIEVHVKEFVGA